jgi:polysaccharide biosynthesis transport protein
MSSDLTQYTGQGPAAVSPPQNPLLVAHRGLRGRYGIAIALAVALAIPMGVAGYFATKPLYTSTGLVRIEVSRTPLMAQTELTEAIKNIEAELQWHVAMLKSERVLMEAVTSDELQDAGWEPLPEGLRRLSHALSVSSQRRSDMIAVEVAHKDPKLSKIATDQILTAYLEFQDDSANQEFQTRQEDLKQLVSELEGKLETLRKRRTDLEQQSDTSDLTYRLSQLEDRRSIIEGQIQANEMLIIQLDAQNKESSDESSVDPVTRGEPDSADPVDDVDVFALAENDIELKSLLGRREDLRTQTALAADRFSPDHPDRVRKESQLRVIEGLVRDRVALLQKFDPTLVSTKTGDTERDAAVQRIADHQTMLQTLRDEIQTLILARSRLQGVRDEIEEAQQKLVRARAREEDLEVERKSLKDKKNVGRAFIAQKGTSPLEPSTDRRIPLTVAGALFGGGLGMGLVSLLGLVRGGLRYIDDFESPAMRAPLLGCLPDLESEDERANDMAALSVHHIRSMLEVRHGDPDSSRTLLVTSPSTGDGKTSLSLSLASSFAIAGHKTVIVDGDLVGRGLTRELSLELEPGLVDALRTGNLNGEVHDTATPNLCAVPVGAPGLCTPEHLSTDHVRSLLSSLRDEFDYVLIDTGPVLGSIEANVLAPLSDEVILVVGKGRANRVVSASLDRLDRLNASCRGVVFNRADVADFSRSVSTASLSVGSSGSDAEREPSAQGNDKSLVSSLRENKRDK